MNEIQLVTVERVPAGKDGTHFQRLRFLLSVENLGYAKEVDVVWTLGQGAWLSLSARYRGPVGEHREYWQAQASIAEVFGHAGSGVIRFALRLRCAGQEYWDNNLGADYFIPEEPGIMIHRDVPLQNLDWEDGLHDRQQLVPLRVAVNPALAAEQVVVHWSTDQWQHTWQTACRLENRVQPHGAELWTAGLPVGDAYRLAYSITAGNRARQVWDNHGGQNYQARRAPLTILILNLHCYQEEDQDRKLTQIAAAIDDLQVGVVCFQEVAENWNQGEGDRASNAARIINGRLRHPLHICTDWSHLGFDRHREGVAILSRYPIMQHHGRYVSNGNDIHNIHSRKVLMARLRIPYMGLVNVFSVHLSWWEDGFQTQFQRLAAWAHAEALEGGGTSLLCGDFNVTPGSAGYRYAVEEKQYEDQCLAVHQAGLFQQLDRINDPHWRNFPGADCRVDYIFMRKGEALAVTSARTLFTDQDYGRVSDHCGYLMTFEPR